MANFKPMFGGASAAPSSAPAGFAPMFGKGGAGSTFRALGADSGAAIPATPPAPTVDIEALVAKARREALAEARRELEAEMRQVQATGAALSEALTQISGLRSRAVRAAAADVGAMVSHLARRVVGDSLALHPDALPGLVDGAVSQLPDDDDLVIRVAPDDVARVRDALDDRFEDRVVGDPAIGAGCRVETRHASIDATLETTMSAVEGAIKAWVEARS